MAGLYGACAPCRIRGSIIIVRAVIIRMVLGSRTESGGLAERLNAPVLKTGVPERAPEVRILHPPPWCGTNSYPVVLRGRPPPLWREITYCIQTNQKYLRLVSSLTG